MSREILLLVDALACERTSARKSCLARWSWRWPPPPRKKNQEDIDVRVEIDRNNTGDYHSFRRWQLVEDNDHEYPSRQVAVSDLDERHAGLELGDFYEEPLEAIEFGRIGAQTAKQVILQKSATPNANRC